MNGKEILYFPSGKTKSIAFVKNDTLRGFDIDFKENGDTLKWFYKGEHGLNGVFHKKWLDNGLILTGQYGNSLRSYVVWNWWDKTNKIFKSKVAKSKNEEYVAPE
jgi:antitoxin component YwqK of YwqJK toxin-antitoxin module